MVPFVGRQHERSALRTLLADAGSGQPQVVQIQGPAGIGKTALLDTFLAEIRTDQSAVVLQASGEETESLLSYGVIEQLIRTAPPGVEGGPRPDPGRPVDDPVTVGTRVLELLDRFGGGALVIAVDDAHWADRPSLQALVFALRRLVADRVLAVLTVRDESVADLPDSLTRLVQGQRGTALSLRGLDERDLRDLAAAMGVGDIDSTAARRLRYGTQGNPLHARALLEEFPPTEWGSEDRLLPSPRSFRRLVEDRYSVCAEPTRTLIDAAAVLRPNTPLPLASALAGLSDPLQALDEATRSELLEASEARSPWTLSFAHPLVRAAVYDALGPARRHVLHTRAAALVADETEALRHRVAAAVAPDETLASDLTRMAEGEASRQAWQSAAAHLAAASRLSPDPAEAQRRVLHSVLWTMLRGDAATAAAYAEEIAGYEAGPLRDAVLGSLGMANEDPATAERRLAVAWAECSPTEDPEVAAIVAVLTAIHCYGRLDADATLAWCDRALAASAPGTATRAVAQTYLLHGLGYTGRRAEFAAAAAAAQDQPEQASPLWLNPRGARGVLRLVDDDLDGARADLESVATTASRLGILNTASFAFAYLARAEWVAGAWDDALVHAERAVAINLQSDFGFLQTAVGGIAALVPVSRGDWAAAESQLAAMTVTPVGYERSVVALGMAQARLGEARGSAAATLTALEPVRRFRQRGAVDEPGFWPWQDLYADALVSAGRADEADGFLTPHEELAAARGRRTTMARLARARGRVEAALGRPESAEASYRFALATLDGLEVPFERARVELAFGRFLRRSGQRRRAADLLGLAQDRFLALGAAPYAEQSAKELAASGLTPTRRLGRDPTSLTSQELVVARLAAQGRSNREAADELVVSIKTIEYHLRNAFAKLGVTSRRQLPERLAELTPRPDLSS